MEVIQPGLLSLLQDRGRFGRHRIGLTNGGPLDGEAFDMVIDAVGYAATRAPASAFAHYIY